MHRTKTPQDHFESINVFVKENLWKESKIHFGDPCRPPSPHFPSSFTWRLPQFFSDFPVSALHNNCPGCQSTDKASHRAQPHFLSKSRIEDFDHLLLQRNNHDWLCAHYAQQWWQRRKLLLGNASGKGVYQCCLVDVEMSKHYELV